MISRTACALALAVSLGACQAPISANPVADILAGSPIAKQAATDAQDAQANLTQAVAVGALPANDPALACVTQANAALGIGAAPGPSFTPKVSGIESFASVAYIRAQQLKKSGAGMAIPDSCKIILENMHLDALAAGVKGLPGGGLIPTLH